MKGKRGRYKTKDKVIIKLSKYYNEVIKNKENGKRDIQ